MRYIVIGIPDNDHFSLPAAISSYTVFSGGTRHYGLVKHLLPADHEWIPIKGDMPALFERYKEYDTTIVVFASGDPLFYGFANTIQKYHPLSELQIYPHFNSLQVLCQRTNTAYHHIRNTSVHGRSWQELDHALISREPLIGVLTDNTKTPAAIAQRMLEYGFSNYQMIVGECLEGNEERIQTLHLQEAAEQVFNPLNCVLLKEIAILPRSFGIADDQFMGLHNRPNMITKMPVRLLTLAQLDLANKQSFWDIGFCTAAVCIEARQQFPRLQIVAFEKRPECSEIFDINTRIHHTPGIVKVMGDVFDYPFSESVDAVFIGGHGNRLEELVERIHPFIAPKGRIVINAVKEESKAQFLKAMEALPYRLLAPISITVDPHNPITILTAERL